MAEHKVPHGKVSVQRQGDLIKKMRKMRIDIEANGKAYGKPGADRSPTCPASE